MELNRNILEPHLDLCGTFVSTAGDVDDKRPLVRLHEHPCGLGTGGVVGSGAAAMRALHAATRRLLHPLLTIVALLRRGARRSAQ